MPKISEMPMTQNWWETQRFNFFFQAFPISKTNEFTKKEKNSKTREKHFIRKTMKKMKQNLIRTLKNFSKKDKFG